MKFYKNFKQPFILILLFIIAVIFWDNILLYPIKLFVVLLHELSHGLVAIFFGGEIQAIKISPQIGGHILYTISPSRISRILIASAGYLGSMFWGGLILILSIRTNWDRFISLIIGVITLVLSFFVIKSGELFGIVFCFSFAFFMILSFRYLENWFHDYVLKFIGITSCLYVILDIKSDLIDRSGIGSDADTIAQMIWIPSILIGIFWFIVAIIFLYKILNMSFRKVENEK